MCGFISQPNKNIYRGNPNHISGTKLSDKLTLYITATWLWLRWYSACYVIADGKVFVKSPLLESNPWQWFLALATTFSYKRGGCSWMSVLDDPLTTRRLAVSAMADWFTHHWLWINFCEHVTPVKCRPTERVQTVHETVKLELAQVFVEMSCSST